MSARPRGRVTAGWWIAVFLATAPLARAGEAAPPRRPEKVVLKSIDARLYVDQKPVNTHGQYPIYRVGKAQGDWLWLVTDCGPRGWAHRRDVVPLDRAVEHFGAEIRRDPKSARAYCLRALVYEHKDDHRRAVRDADRAIRLDPQDALSYEARALARLERRDLKGALADANAAVRLEPRAMRAYLYRAEVHKKRSEFKDALKDYGEAIRLAPDCAFAYVRRSQFFSGKMDLERAIDDATKAIRMDPSFAGAYMSRGFLWINKGDNKQALADFDKVIGFDPNWGRAYFARAMAEAADNDFEKALADCDTATRLGAKEGEQAAHGLRMLVDFDEGKVTAGMGEILHMMIHGNFRLSINHNSFSIETTFR